jgi:hypothetical protein
MRKPNLTLDCFCVCQEGQNIEISYLLGIMCCSAHLTLSIAVNNHLPEGFLFRFESSLRVYTISISLLNQYLSFCSQSNGCQHTDVLTVMNGGGGLRGSGDSIFCIVVVMTVQHSSPSGRSFCGFVCASLVPCFCLRHRLEC